MVNYILYRGGWVFSGEPHCEVQLSEYQASKILSEGGYLLRNCYDFDCKEPTSFWYLIKDTYQGSSEYSKKINKYIEKAHAKFDIRLISREMMCEQGLNVMAAAYNQYKVHEYKLPNKDEWIKEMYGYDDSIDFWGCIDRETGLLQAYSICKRNKDSVNLQSSKVNPAFLPKFYPMYGLYDARNRYYLQEKGYKYVITSARSITQHSHIQEFMIDKMNFRKAYARMKVYYRTPLKMMVNILYPFRKYIPIRKVRILLYQEAMSRNELKDE